MNGGKIDKISDEIPPFLLSNKYRAWWRCKICGSPYESWYNPPHIHCDGKVHNEIKRNGYEVTMQKILSDNFRLPKETNEKTP